MRYTVYKWYKEDLETYLEIYGTELSVEPKYTNTIIQFGTIVKCTDDIDEAYKCCSKAQDEVGYYGLTSIYDSNEKEWFN